MFIRTIITNQGIDQVTTTGSATFSFDPSGGRAAEDVGSNISFFVSGSNTPYSSSEYTPESVAVLGDTHVSGSLVVDSGMALLGDVVEITASVYFSGSTVFSGALQVTGNVSVQGGLSGSLQALPNGSPYLVAGPYINIVTNSLGQVEVSGTAAPGIFTVSGTYAKTTSSVSFGADDQYADYYDHAYVFYVSGSTGYDSSVAGFGGDVRISGSLAQGLDVTTTGAASYSHAEGSGSLTRGAYSHAEGDNTQTGGAAAHAEGYQTRAGGDYSHAEGGSTTTDDAAEGSHAEGFETTTYGLYSHAEGSGSIAHGDYSHAEGFESTASGTYSHAEGVGTTAEGYSSHAEGASTLALGVSSHAEGHATIASGWWSHAEGSGSFSAGNWSHAGGIGTIASGSGQTVVGQWNLDNNTTSLFVVGNGTSNVARSDALWVNPSSVNVSSSFYVSGAVEIDGDTLEITGSVIATNGFSGSLTVLSDGTTPYLVAGPNIVLHTNSIGQVEVSASVSPAVSGSIFTVSGTYAKTTSSVYFGDDFVYNDAIGSDVFFYVSGSISGSGADDKKSVFGGDVRISGSLLQGYIDAASFVGLEAHAQGASTVASGYASHAEGQNTTASGDASHTEGGFTAANGYASHAEGSNTTASGSFSHAEGQSTAASGSYSHAEGFYTTTNGSYSHAEGVSTTASGDCSHAEGQSTAANGVASHAEGYYTTASGYASHAEGAGNTASGVYSHAEGQDTTASGYASHAEGSGSIAHGDYSHAEGLGAIAVGDYSHAGGQGTIASGTYQTVFGVYNIGNADSLFIVGNGDLNTKSDVLRVNSGTLNDGQVEVIGSLVATTGLSGSLTRLSNGIDPYLVAGPNIVINTGSNGSVQISGSIMSVETHSGSGPFTAALSGFVLVEPGTSDPTVLNLPTGAPTGFQMIVKRKDTTPNSHILEVSGSGGDTIDNSSGVKISTNYGSMTFIKMPGSWYVV